LPVFVPAEVSLSGAPWCMVGYVLWEKYHDKGNDFFLHRPVLSLDYFGVKAADSTDATALGVSLFSELRVPRKRFEEGGKDTWAESEELLLVGRLAEGWTNHSERATVVSALAALGVDKGRRNMLGRWSPDGSDDYVRTHRAIVRELLGKFMGPVVAGNSFEAYDEGEIVSEVSKRLKARDMDEIEVDSWAADFKGKAMVVSKAFGFMEPGSPTEVASLPSVELSPGEVEEDEPTSKYVVSITRGGSCARLHKAMGCWRARRLAFAKYELLDLDPPPQDSYSDYCRTCWKREGAAASVPPVGSSSSGDDSSSTSGDEAGEGSRPGPSEPADSS